MAIPVVVLVVILGVVLFKGDDSKYQTDLQRLAAPQASDPRCAALMADLPEHLKTFDSKQMHSGYAEWPAGTDNKGPVQVRCGVDRPAELGDTSALVAVDGIQWFTVSARNGAQGQLSYAVDHRPYVALWVPDNGGNEAIGAVSALVAKHLTPGPIDLGPGPSSSPAPTR